jgi:predicted DsbA family dithiol-disulfide isomerase
VQVEIWADIVCPWCFIGKRRFEQALADFQGREQVTVVHRAFQLDPAAVSDGRRTVDVLARKYDISVQQAADMMSDVSDTAAESGLRYQLAETVSGNTADAHRAVLWAQQDGHGDVLLEALFSAYFERAEPVFTGAELRPIVAGVGLAADALLTMLDSQDYLDDIVADQAAAAQLGARGVPFFVFDRRLAVAGAQPVSTFASALAQVG